jgi:hypothetical protein
MRHERGCMRFVVVTVSVIVLATACTSVSRMEWQDTGDAKKFARDEYECERQTRQDASSLISLRSERDSWFQRCMEGRDYIRKQTQ